MATNQLKDLHILINHIEKYRHKAVVLREIHSKLAQNCRKSDVIFTVLTVTLVSFTAFLGFSGADTLREVIVTASGSQNSTDTYISLLDNEKTFSFIFNFLVFIVFLGSLFNLIYRWKENHTVHFQGVVKLTQFMNWLDTTKVLARAYDKQIIKDISSRYEAIIDILPPNNDSDYLDAKKSLLKKMTPKNDRCACLIKPLKGLLFDLFSINFDKPMKGDVFFKDLIISSGFIMSLLKSIRNTDDRLWLGGGLIRNFVWDELTGRTTPIGDIDIVYYDHKNTSEEADKKIENLLIEKSGLALKWSVKNQARMYQNTHESEVTDLYAAIYNWPETATSIIIRLDELGKLRIIAPHGLDDLFSLVVRPTPFHTKNPATYKRRLVEKKWLENWPELDLQKLE